MLDDMEEHVRIIWNSRLTWESDVNFVREYGIDWREFEFVCKLRYSKLNIGLVLVRCEDEKRTFKSFVFERKHYLRASLNVRLKQTEGYRYLKANFPSCRKVLMRNCLTFSKSDEAIMRLMFGGS